MKITKLVLGVVAATSDYKKREEIPIQTILMILAEEKEIRSSLFFVWFMIL